MPNQALSKVRNSVLPAADDTWETIARTALPEIETEAAIGMLQSWNLHVFMRPAPPAASPRAGNPILPSDVIFVEAPAVQ